MTLLSTLLRTTAERYQAAARDVMASWTPECGCVRPGISATCEACPSLAIFRQRVSQKIVEAAPPTKEKAATVPPTTQSMETSNYDLPSPATTPLNPERAHKSGKRKRRATNCASV
jgi:hypothetical protein